MPHLSIDYSSRLAGLFDSAALIRELHPLVLEETGSSGVCKTFLRPSETYVGEGAGEGDAFIHVEIGLMPGRSETRKAHLSESVLVLIAKHLPADRPDRPDGPDGVTVSVEVRDLAASYRLSPAGKPVPGPTAPAGRQRSPAAAPPGNGASAGRGTGHGVRPR